jgi:cysteine desulfurase
MIRRAGSRSARLSPHNAMQPAVYMDYNATAPLRPEAAAVVAETMELTGNASSVHGFGRRVRGRIEDAREAVAALAGARPEDVIFTSGGTESNNLALRGCGRERILVSAGEHDSVLQAVPDAEPIPLKRDGRVALSRLAAMLAGDPRPALVSVMLANNETGVIQPVREVAVLAREFGALVHCDAVQAAGKIPVDMGALDVDLLSLSAHKLGGPQGVGALVAAGGVELAPLICGGGQERRRRAGTENAAGIAGFGAAAEAAERGLGDFARLAALRDGLEAKLGNLAPEAEVFGAAAPRLANTTCFAAPGMPAETQVMALDLAGVAVSAGSACSSGKVTPSHVLRAMGCGEAAAASAIRVSLGWRSGPEDIERFLDAWGGLYSGIAAGTRTAETAA